MDNTGNKLLMLRKQHGYTQDEIAEKIGLSRYAYYRYETNQKKPNFETIKKLADIYGVSSDYLLNIESNTQDTDEIMELREQLRRDPSTKMLFSLAKDATTDDILVAANVLKALKDKQ